MIVYPVSAYAACEMFPVAHPDRVVWYYSLIQDWTAQIPMIAIDDQELVLWINPYSSQAGLNHAQPTGVRAQTLEQGLEQLANDIYADLQQDLATLQAAQGSAMIPAGGR